MRVSRRCEQEHRTWRCQEISTALANRDKDEIAPRESHTVFEESLSSEGTLTLPWGALAGAAGDDGDEARVLSKEFPTR